MFKGALILSVGFVGGYAMAISHMPEVREFLTLARENWKTQDDNANTNSDEIVVEAEVLS